MLECKNVCVENIADGISFMAESGRFTAIIGKNGSGKTTLAKCIMGEKKFNGEITLFGTLLCEMPLSKRAEKIAYLPQSLPTPNISVYELVTLGRTPYIHLGSKLCEKDIALIENALCICGVSNLKERMLPTLSGGEKQRAFLAMLLAQGTDILLLDEPCAHLDMAAAAEFCELLSSLGKTLIVIMHDLTLAVKHADEVLILNQGKQVFSGSKEDCLGGDIIEKTFGVRRIEKDGETVFLV